MKIETIVIIPNYNGTAHLKECINSLFSQTYKNFKIVIIDDASTDKSVIFLKQNFPEIEVLFSKTNRGFAKSVNRALTFAAEKYRPKYFILLNNDARADKNWIEELVKFANLKKNIGAVASNMLFWDNPGIINSQGGVCNKIGIGKDINFSRKNENIKAQKEVLSPCFGAALLKAEFLPKIGLLDERYFAYCEDLDWGMRSAIFGYKTIFNEKAVVFHKGSASFKNKESKKIYLCLRNSLCTIIKNYELKNLIKTIPLLVDYYLKFSAGYLINRKIENKKIVKIFKNKNFCGRLKISIVPLFAVFWNLKNICRTLKKRRQIQLQRLSNDDVIKKYFKNF